MRWKLLHASLTAAFALGCASGPHLRLQPERDVPLVIPGGGSRPLELSEQELLDGMQSLITELRGVRQLRLEVSEPELREALEGLVRGIRASRHVLPGPAERLAMEWLDLRTGDPGEVLLVLPAGLEYAGDAGDSLTSSYQAWCDRRGEPADCEGLLAGGEWNSRQRERLAMAVAMTHFYEGAAAYAQQAIDPIRVRAALAGMIVWYLGMLIIPEPISKAIAVSLTVAMISYVGVDTFLGIVEGYRRLKKEVAATWSFGAIAQAGERFGLLIGGTVGRTLVLLTTWAVARTVGAATKIPDPPRFPAAAAAAATRYGINLRAAMAGGARTVMVTGPTLAITLASGTMAMVHGSEAQKSVEPPANSKPSYRPNPAHTPGRPGFNPGKTIEPADAASVYERAILGPNGKWYGRSANGEIYRFSPDNAGGAHFSGSTGGSRGLNPNDIPIGVRRALGGSR